MKKLLRRGAIALLCISAALSHVSGQIHVSPISTMIEENREAFASEPVFRMMRPSATTSLLNDQVKSYLNKAYFFELDFAKLNQLVRQKQAIIKLEILWFDGEAKTLLLTRANVFSDEFKMHLGSDRKSILPIHRGEHYWGVVEGEKGSVAAISLFENEIAGMVQIGDKNYTLGKMENQTYPVFILYQDDQLEADFEFSCYSDSSDEYLVEDVDQDFEGEMKSQGQKCIKMYIEVDYDITAGKGSVNNAANYVTGLFSQVALLYANDGISVVLHELVVWDVQDPYTGPATRDYLSQFRSQLNGVFNGDLAHLIGYKGGGGVAYLNVICSTLNGVGYSAVHASYNNVPTYSWSVMVVAHEIGHNLGAWHTHDCRWNGNNTPIDCCGSNAGYSGSGCTTDYNCNIPDPAGGGTIMSYCHLRSVGINFNHGFGPQPTARMMGRIDAATCLTNCSGSDPDPEPDPDINDAGITNIIDPTGMVCDDFIYPVVELKNFGNVNLNQVTIRYQLNSGTQQNYQWQGTLAPNATVQVTLPIINYSEGQHGFTAYTQLPNNQPDNNNSNNQSASTFQYIADFCTCEEAVAEFPTNPLTHSGGGSSSTTILFSTGSKNASFVVSNLTSVTNGPPNNRYIDRVEITYLDGNMQSQLYGIFNGNEHNPVQVEILDFVNSVTVRLSNGIVNNYGGVLSVNLSQVDYCIGDQSDCNDSDGDGICDEDDICPGFDDNLIGTPCDDGDPCTTNDVYTTNCICQGTPIPDCGETDCLNEETYSFIFNPLTHTGPGYSTSALEVLPGTNSLDFTVSGLSSKTNGPPNGRYIDMVTVNYINGNGDEVLYGTYYGNTVSSFNVEIDDDVSSVSVRLEDAWDGDASPNTLIVYLSEVTTCHSSGNLIQSNHKENLPANKVTVHPNPARDVLYVNWMESVSVKSKIIVYNSIGMQIAAYDMDIAQHMELNISDWTNVSNLIFIKIIPEGMEPVTKSVMIVK